MECSGTCTSWNWKGFGFIDMAGATVFVHQSECEQGKVPKVGDVLTFTTEPRRNNPEQVQAKSVKGCTGQAEVPWTPAGFQGPIEGTGAHTGKCKSFGPKGYGFIIMEDGAEMFFNVKDCVGSKPIAGDTVKFDVVQSDSKPGQMQAKNITGGSQSLDSPHPGSKANWGKGDWGWGGKGMMGMMDWAFGKGGMGWGGDKGWGKGGFGGGAMGPYSKGFGKGW
ncbi:unnamed protein product [Effrenium voratum]|uniref:CSD domain-containing protein n=1 Tax=Effrenium voratum TaxID=2562239 RepID=A0AA36MNX6_9DINO|nr:unnamed protein product [Effrenium voratum]